MNRGRLFAWGIVAVLAAAFVRTNGTSASGPAPKNLVLVTLDTTRADRLPPYGFQSASMPAIEQLAHEGVVFLQAFTVAPLTLPAHCSLMTGLYPPHHHVRDNADPPLDAAHPTLAELLRARGFRTAAFVAADVLSADRGLARGFDVYRDATTTSVPHPRRPANEVVDDALGWLHAGDESRFFLWVHLYDAHAPYQPPEPYRSRFATDAYEGSLAFIDAQVGRLIHRLEADGELNRTLIVVAGDHGESLGEHGELEHGFFLYDSVLRVPLIMRGRGVDAGRFLPVTSLVDVMPTVLGLLQLPSRGADGIDLTSSIRDAARTPDRDIYAESLYPRRFGLSGLRAIRGGGSKFIDAPQPEFYQLATDPFEEHNLYQVGSTLPALMRARLDAFDPQRSDESASAIAPADVRARLAALGYVGGRTPDAHATSRDPKDYVEVYNATRRANHLRVR